MKDQLPLIIDQVYTMKDQLPLIDQVYTMKNQLPLVLTKIGVILYECGHGSEISSYAMC